MWLDPYLTRFPVPADVRYITVKKHKEQQLQPLWIRVIKPPALPMEPLSGSRWVNILLWKRTLDTLNAFAEQGSTLLTIGKPSELALASLERLKNCQSLYDAMDNFPDFYSGLVRSSIKRREEKIAQRVSAIFVSSTALKKRWEKLRLDVQLVRNGVDDSILPEPKAMTEGKDSKVLGYTGTIAGWFDWQWVTALAKTRPKDMIRLIGPIFGRLPTGLPRNIEVLPPIHHEAAVKAMSEFDAGLIPFKKNELTASVDPIKYYEYRALGLPVISTDFGEMNLRRSEEGVFLSVGLRDIPHVIERALQHRTTREASLEFKAGNTWQTRFDGANLM